MTLNDSDQKPNWLKKLQLNSWEPEILLAGIVLYGMLQVPEVLDRFLLHFSTEVYDDINAMDTLVALLKVGVYWLIIGLILHLICRGFWVGMVGLSYAFPKGIISEKLKFQPKYLARAQAVPSFDDIILKLERLCSFIYSVALLLFMSLVGTYIYATVLIIVPMVVLAGILDPVYLNQDMFDMMESYGNGVLYFGLIGVVDFLTMGYFRRFKIVAQIYWPFYRLFNSLTLAKYYRPTYLAMVTNLNRWWLFIFFTTFAFFSFIGIQAVQNNAPGGSFSRMDIWSNQLGNKAFEGYYQDKNTKIPSSRIQIPSEIISGDVLRVFIPLSISMQDSLKKFMNYDSLSNITDPSFNKGRYYLDHLGDFYRLTVADSTFKTKGYFQNSSATNQRGYITYLNIGYLEEGLYELTLEGPKEMYSDPFSIVPFYKVD